MIALSGLLAATVVLCVGASIRPVPARVVGLRARFPSRPRSAPTWLGRSVRVVTVIVVAVVGGPLVAVLVIVAPRVIRILMSIVARRRRAAEAVRAYPDVVDLLVLTVRAGRTPLQACEQLIAVVAEPFRSALEGVLSRVRLGERFGDAIQALPFAIGDVARPLADSLTLADRYGNPLPPMLDRLAAEARADRRRHAEAAARRLPVLLSFPLVACTLPSFVLLTIVPLLAGTLSSLRSMSS